MKPELNDEVFVAFEGRLVNGDLFDNATDEQPFFFTIGSNKVLKSFEEEIMNLEEGEETFFIIPKEKAYGEKDPKLVFEMNKEVFSEYDIEVNMIVLLNAPNGEKIPAKILEINNDKITIDLNPILAGEDLTFKVKLLRILKPKK